MLVLVLGLLVSSAEAERAKRRVSAAATLRCSSITDVSGLRDVLYKNANLHGGRGRTFLDQSHRLGGVRTLKVAGTNNKIFGCFGIFACDRPYGCRYYQALCGDGLSNSQFAAKARQNGGSKYALVGDGGKRGKCFKIDASASRYGSVRD